jgi:hypothetical protein
MTIFLREASFDVDDDCFEVYFGFTDEDMGGKRARPWGDPKYWFGHGVS